jgi:hypothetical protein
MYCETITAYRALECGTDRYTAKIICPRQNRRQNNKKYILTF